MSIRTDEAQLIITINAKESVEYQKSVQRSSELVRNMRNLEAGTEEYNKALKEQIEISRKLAGADYSKLSIKNLQDRRAALQQQIRLLPQAAAAELGLNTELQRVNQALSENAQRTRAVNQVTNTAMSSVKGFIAAYAGFAAIKATTVALFEQVKEIDSLDKAYAKIIPEQDKLARANEYLARMAENYGIEINGLRETYLKYTASAQSSTLTMTEQEQVFESVAKATSVLGLSTDKQKSAFVAIEQMISKNTVSSEELKVQLGDALPGAFKIMADAVGVSSAELEDMLKKGEVAASDVLPKFAVALEKAYGIENVDRVDTIAAAQNRFKNTLTEVAAKLGEDLAPLFIKFFNILANGLTYIVTFVNVIKAIPQFIKDNEVALKLMVTGLILFNSQMILAAANSLRLAAAEKGRAIITAAVTKAQKLLDGAMTANPIGLVIKAVGLLVTGFGILYAKSQTVRAGIAGLGEVAKEIFSIIKESVGAFIKGFEKLGEGDFKGAFKSFSESLAKSNPIGIALTQGKRLKEAFNRGYNDKVEAERSKKEAEKQAKELVKSYEDIAKKDPVKEVEEKDKDKKAKEPKAKKEKDTGGLPDFLHPDFLEKMLAERLKRFEAAAKREQTFLEEQYQQGNITEDQYNLEKLRLLSANLATQLELLDAAGYKESDKRREIHIRLLQTEKQINDERLKQITDNENAALDVVEMKFAEGLISEQEYAVSRLRVQMNFYDEQLRLLEENGFKETDVYNQILLQKLKAQKDYNALKVENEEKTRQLINNIQQEAFSVTSDLFALTGEILKEDTANRKKRAAAIKTFESGAVLVNSIAEIAENYKQSAKLGPVIGPIIGTARAIATAVRAGIAISKIHAQQFYRGGRIRSVSGQLINERPNISTLPGGDNVLIAAQPGEVVLNRRQQAALGGHDTFRRIGVPGFNTGGIITPPNTTPSGISADILSRQPVQPQQSDPRIDQLIGAVAYMAKAIPESIASMDLKTHVVYGDIEKKANTANEITRIASY